jgi:hypothetical protein
LLLLLSWPPLLDGPPLPPPGAKIGKVGEEDTKGGGESGESVNEGEGESRLVRKGVSVKGGMSEVGGTLATEPPSLKQIPRMQIC